MSVMYPANAQTKKDHRKKLGTLVSRNICDGRIVESASLSNPIIEPFHLLEWSAFLVVSGPVYDQLVREFYASFEYDTEKDKVTFVLRGNLYTMPLSIFGNHLGVPITGQRFYSVGKSFSNMPNFLDGNEVWTLLSSSPFDKSRGIKSGSLKPPHDMRYKIIDWNVYCRDGNRNEVQASEAALLWCLDRQEPVNLAYFIASRMNGLVTNGTRSLPYGMLLTNLFQNLGIQNRGVGRNPSRQFIGVSTVDKMKRSLSKSKSKRARNNSSSDDEEFEYRRQASKGSGPSDVGDGASGSGAHVEENIEVEHSSGELSPEDQNDAFYTMSTSNQMSVLYRQQSRIRREQKGIKRLLGKILKAVTCNSNAPHSPRL